MCIGFQAFLMRRHHQIRHESLVNPVNYGIPETLDHHPNAYDDRNADHKSRQRDAVSTRRPDNLIHGQAGHGPRVEARPRSPTKNIKGGHF